jgi:hypothetical protein
MVLLMLFAMGMARVEAHEFTMEAVVNTFVKVEPTEVHVVVRAPLYLFKEVRFPIKNAEIDIADADAAMQRALAALQQALVIYENGQPLKAKASAGRLALPSDRSFENYSEAVRHVATPIEPDTRIVVDQGYVDAHLVYPANAPANAVYSLRTVIAPELGDYLKLAVRYTAADGETSTMVMRNSSGTVDLNPTWWGAASGFVGLGLAHILTGYDHLLFLLCLVIPLRSLRQLLAIVTAFTLAHSFTLIGSAFGLAPRGAWFPPAVEMCIAVSIVYTALENIVGVKLSRRVMLSMLFGLVHGFAFSYGLQQELQFAGTHLLVSLFAFNLGIELGQILALFVMLPVLFFVTRKVLPGRVGAIILSALLAHVGWHWMEERWSAVAKVPWPKPDMASLSAMALWAAGLLVLAAVVVAAVRRLRLAEA